MVRHLVEETVDYELRGKKATAKNRAISRAYTNLRRAHREEYKQYYAEELIKAMREVGLVEPTVEGVDSDTEETKA